MMMAAVKEVQQRTGEQEGVGYQAEQVLPMLRIEQVGRDNACRYRREQPGPSAAKVHSAIILRRSELPMTLTDERAIAAAAMMGESMRPNRG